MSAPQNPRVTQVDYDLLRLLDVPATADHLLMAAHHREAAEAASKAREAALVEALKSAPLIGSTEHPHTFRCRQDVWLRDVFTPALAALTKEPDA